MATHKLKIWPSYIQAILDGTKTFEVRKADRDFAVGDDLWLQVFDPVDGYTDNRWCSLPQLPTPGPLQGLSGELARTLVARVVYMLPPAHCPPGFVVMGIRSVQR